MVQPFRHPLDGRVRRLRAMRFRGLDACRQPPRTGTAPSSNLLLNHERRSFHTIAARPAVTAKVTPLAQSGIVIPLIDMSQPNKSRVSCSKETIEKTITATRVKGLFIFRSIRESRDVTRSDGLRGA